MARIEINTNGMVPLAIPSSGTVTANERAKIQGVETGAQVNVLNDVNLIYPAADPVQKSFVSKVQNFTFRLATAAQEGIMSVAQVVQLNKATTDNTSQDSQIAGLASIINANGALVNLIGLTDVFPLAAEVPIGNTGMQDVVVYAAPRNVQKLQLLGNITFRNSGGAVGIGYWRLVQQGGTILASGQCEVNAGQRESVGFGTVDAVAAGQYIAGTQWKLQARSSLAGGVMLVSHQNGLADTRATQLVGTYLG